MKNQQDNKMSLRECFVLNYRACQLWVQQDKELFLCLTIYSIISAAIPYVTIYFSAQIIGELSSARDVSVLFHLIILTMLSTFLLVLLKAVLERWRNYKRATIYHKRRKIYADKLLDMDFCIIDRQYTHKLFSQISQNETWTGWGLGKSMHYFETFLNSFISMVGAGILTVSLFSSVIPETAGKMVVFNSPVFAVLLFVTLMLVTILAPICKNKAERYWAYNAENTNQGNRFFSFFGFMGQEHYRALDIRIYEQQNICNYYANKEKVFSPGSQIARYAKGPMGAWHALSAAISAVFTGIIYIFICIKSWAGAFGVGSVTQYIGAITAFSDNMSKLVEVAGGMRNNAVFLKKTFELLDFPNEMQQGEKRISSLKSFEIEFCDVSFRYPGSEVYALRHISMKFKSGERMAVVGVNGSGKTTFIKLLCRLYDPTEGKILLNGIDIRQYDYENYKAFFSVVFQDFKLFSFPLGENIAVDADYDKKKVEDCLVKAGLDKRLKQLPNGMDTCLGKDFDEEGVDMSGGEEQKIAIARALYRDAAFMILDEPTSALDPITEMEVYQKFDEIVENKSVIYISHRLSACCFCDEIAVFHEGRLVQKGSHSTLVEDMNGKYYELWHTQAQYYVE